MVVPYCRAWRAALVSVVVHLLELVAIVGAVVGTLFVMPLLCVASPAVAFEGAGPIAAVRRSVQLTRGQYHHAAAFVFFNAFVVFLVGLLFGWLPATIASALGDTGYGWVVVGVTGVVFSVVATAFTALGATLFYLNLRIRGEGMDIALRATELFPA